MKPGGKRRIIIPPELGPPVSIVTTSEFLQLMKDICISMEKKKCFCADIVGSDFFLIFLCHRLDLQHFSAQSNSKFLMWN